MSMSVFDRQKLYTDLQKPPAMKFKDLEAVMSIVKYSTLPMQVRADYIPVTGSSVLTFITFSSTAKISSSNRRKESLPPP